MEKRARERERPGQVWSIGHAEGQSSFAQGTESRFLLRRQRSLQYFTFSQSSSHFFRHSNSRLQTGQIFVGRLPFWWLIGRMKSVMRDAR